MQNVKLNLIPGSVMPVVNVSQYDKARQFSITVYEGASTYSLTGKDVQIRGTKPDGNGFAYDATDGVVSVSGSTVTISTTQQMTAVGGQTMAELRITQSGVILGTLNFVLMVEPSALSDDTPISDTDIPAIERDFEAALAEAEADALIAEGYAKGTQDGTPAQSGEPYYQDNAKYYKEQAEAAASGGGADALKAEGYAVGTQNGVPVTSGSPYYQNNAKYYEGEASTSATNAATSETNAGLSETAAGNSATNAAADALKSEGWAVGEQNGTPVTSGSPYYHNNAEYYKDQAAQYAAGGLIFKGSVAFASIPTTGMVNGDMYNITDDFTTDNRFIEGSGVSVKAGADIAWIDSVSKWDILALGGGTDSLSGLQDVTLTSPASGQVLEYDGSKWANANLPTVPADLDDLGDVDLTTPTSGQFLKYDGSKWVNGNGGGGASALDDLTDVDITTPTDGQVLTYDADSQKWVNANGGGGGGGFVLADWLTAGGLNPMSYADLAAVLADEKAVRKLMTIHLAVDYLAGQTAVDASINTILTDNTCAKWINLRDYALDTLYDNALFASIMNASGKYFLGEWAKLSTSPETWGPKGNVPIMTANNAPYGTASAYQVFDGNNATTASGTDFSYKFVNPVCVKDFVVKDGSGNAITGGTLQASNDGSTWVTPVADTFYMAWNVHFGSSTTVGTVQFYGREMKVSVPVMTSNTAPYGVASADSNTNPSTPAYMSFNASQDGWGHNVTGQEGWVMYDFGTPVVIKKFTHKNRSSKYCRPKSFKLQGTNDGVTFDDLTDTITLGNSYDVASALYSCDVNNSTPYRYYRLYIYSVFAMSGNPGYCGCGQLRFYGFDYSEYDWDADNPRHYLYDHGVEPNGALERMTSENGWSQSGRTFAQNSQKLPYGLYIAPTTSGIVDGFGVSNSIDLSAYNLMRYIADANGSSGTDSCLFFSICSAKTNFESPSRIANDNFYGKPSGSLDISAINQNAFPCTYSINYYLRTGYVYEMWFE